MTDQSAQGRDGELLDMSQIQWYYDADDSCPMQDPIGECKHYSMLLNDWWYMYRPMETSSSQHKKIHDLLMPLQLNKSMSMAIPLNHSSGEPCNPAKPRLLANTSMSMMPVLMLTMTISLPLQLLLTQNLKQTMVLESWLKRFIIVHYWWSAANNIHCHSDYWYTIFENHPGTQWWKGNLKIKM